MRWADSVRLDVRFAARTLARRPIFTAAAALTLALGIAAATAMFSLVDGILLRPLPYPDASRLVEVMQSYPEKGLDRWTLSQQNVAMYRDAAVSFGAFAAHARSGVTLTEHGEAQRLVVELVTGDFFRVMGVAPLLGRTLNRDDDQPHNAGFAVLSYGFWQSHFGGDRAVLGKTIDIGAPVQIVGVMPDGFAFPKPDVQAYISLGLDPTRAHPNFLTGIARLAPGVSVNQARRETSTLMWNWARTAPGMLAPGVERRQTKMAALVTPLRTALTGNVVRPLTVLQAAVLVILLIAVANVATLVGSRGAARSRELAMRVALGATGRRLVRQMLTESLVLAAVGGLLGIGAAYLLVEVFLHSSLVSLPRVEEVAVSWRVLAFAVAMVTLSGVLVGLAPALASRRQRLGDGLAGERASAGGGARRLNRSLVVTQVGLTFVLLVAAGLVLKSFRRLLETNLGFNPSGVTSITMPVPGQRYLGGKNQPRLIGFVESVVSAALGVPGVTSAAVMWPSMYVNDVNTDNYLVEGRTPTTSAGSETQTVQYSISPGFFRALQIPLLYGRDFDASDGATSTPVVIVDEALASRYWNRGEAVGKRIRMTGDTIWRTIVGVVGSIRDESVAAEPRPHTYFPFAQQVGSRPTLVIRTAGDASVGAAKRAIASVDAGVPTDDVHPLTVAINHSLQERRVTEILLIGFACFAVALGACGLYGVMSLQVVSRSREFGIRAAIGARPAELVRIVVAEGFTLVGLGVAGGLVASLVVTRAVRSLLYEVTALDPAVFAMVSGILVLVGTIACYVPARRAAGSDPLMVLREE